MNTPVEAGLARDAETLSNLGVTLAQQGKLDQAIPTLREAVRLKPDYAKAQHNLGVALAHQGRPDEAVGCFRQALQCKQDYAEACYNLGNVLAELKQHDEAVAAYRRAIAIKPDYFDAYNNLGLLLVEPSCSEKVSAVEKGDRTFANIGNPKVDNGPIEVLSPFSTAVWPGLESSEAPARTANGGNAPPGLPRTPAPATRFGEASVLLQQAVRLRPQSPEAHNNLGMVLAELARYAEAERCYQEALRLRPGFADAHANLGNAYKEQGRLEEAVASYSIALAYQPDSVSAHWNRALARLQQGNFKEGWAEYEWRWQRKQTPMRSFRQPRWDGGPLAGRTILLWMEQGLGDMIQFIRYAAPLQEQGARVLVECPGFLIPLFATCPGIDQLVAEGSPLADFDVHAPVMSLPHLGSQKAEVGGQRPEMIAGKVPYLFPQAELVERWGTALRTGSQRIGSK